MGKKVLSNGEREKSLVEAVGRAKLTGCDFCVLCFQPTSYQTNTPINERQNYIEGCGQLCESCAEKILEN